MSINYFSVIGPPIRSIEHHLRTSVLWFCFSSFPFFRLFLFVQGFFELGHRVLKWSFVGKVTLRYVMLLFLQPLHYDSCPQHVHNKNILPKSSLGKWQTMKTPTMKQKIRAKLSSFIRRPIRFEFSELRFNRGIYIMKESSFLATPWNEWFSRFVTTFQQD